MFAEEAHTPLKSILPSFTKNRPCQIRAISSGMDCQLDSSEGHVFVPQPRVLIQIDFYFILVPVVCQAL